MENLSEDIIKISSDAESQNVANANGLVIQTVCWEDTGRSKGSLGPEYLRYDTPSRRSQHACHKKAEFLRRHSRQAHQRI